MVKRNAIVAAINPHLHRVLLAAEAALPGERFPAFRRIVLAELGRNGLQESLQRLLVPGGEPGRDTPATKGGAR